jgi:hypothetical protein
MHSSHGCRPSFQTPCAAEPTRKTQTTKAVRDPGRKNTTSMASASTPPRRSHGPLRLCALQPPRLPPTLKMEAARWRAENPDEGKGPPTRSMPSSPHGCRPTSDQGRGLDGLPGPRPLPRPKNPRRPGRGCHPASLPDPARWNSPPKHLARTSLRHRRCHRAGPPTCT